MKKKLQIFISSTYTDLQEERQAAVEAVLGSNNIPAGMELFKAGNNSQWETIKKWINDSDIYMLILGGRYGTIETLSKKSYTQLEYEYAVSQGIPVFATILSDSFLEEKKRKTNKLEDIIECYNKSLYDDFKKTVMQKMVKIVSDCKDIKLSVYESIAELKEENDFEGWIRGGEEKKYKELFDQNANLIKENNELKLKLDSKLEVKIDPIIEVEFWNKKIDLNISGSNEFMGHLYKTQINITTRQIFNIIAPIIVVPQKTSEAKSDFEENLKEIYMKSKYTLNIENNQFQKIKVMFLSKKLIELSMDKSNNELMKLTDSGCEELFSEKSYRDESL